MALGPFFIGEQVAFTFTIRDKDTDDIVNLSAITSGGAASKAQVYLRKFGATDNRHSGSSLNATVPSDGSLGVVLYSMPSAWSTAEAGQWDAQIQLNFSTGVRMTERFRFTVEQGLA